MRAIRTTVLILAAWIALAAPGFAAGSLGLDEVLAAVAKAPELVAEIRAELDKNKLKPGDVTCIGARHGNHWKYLGGARAAPYECEIGRRTLEIEADRIYFDARGKSLGDLEKADPKRARTFRESNFKWTWTDAGGKKEEK
ncbi:MAG: hypothetical protein Q7U92_23095 [Bradyrhizobium sp.]|nr:hypothetical protein [Bradyrhizobium sp.]